MTVRMLSPLHLSWCHRPILDLLRSIITISIQMTYLPVWASRNISNNCLSSKPYNVHKLPKKLKEEAKLLVTWMPITTSSEYTNIFFLTLETFPNLCLRLWTPAAFPLLPIPRFTASGIRLWIRSITWPIRATQIRWQRNMTTLMPT